MVSEKTYYYLGIDAHCKYHVGLLTDRYERHLDKFRITSDSSGIQQLLNWLKEKHKKYKFSRKELIIGVEGGNRYKDLLISKLLKEGYKIYEVNPVYTQSRRFYRTFQEKTDDIDACLIVEVLSRQLTQLSSLTSLEFEEKNLCLQHQVRFWEDLATTSARLKNQIKRLKHEYKTAPTPKVKETVNMILRTKEEQLKEIEALKLKLKEELKEKVKNSQARHLLEIKGISVVLSSRLMAQIKDIYRFKNINSFIKYAGLAPVACSSGQKERYKRSKNGNRKLHSIIYLIALNQIRWNPISKAYYEKKIREGKNKHQALKCLMKRIATIIYGILKSQREYTPSLREN